MQNSVPSIRITSLYGSKPSSVAFGCKTATLGPDLQVCVGPRPHLWFWADITECLAQELKRQSGFQPSPVVLCMQTATLAHSLYCSLPSSEVFACKPATFGPELQISMGTRPHLSLCACITAPFATELQVSMGSRPHLWFCVLKTGTLELKLHISMGPRPHLWFCACKTACLASE